MSDIKNDCIESIVRVLERTSTWRKSISANFKEDPRNRRASETLDQLAIEAASMSDAQWAQLKDRYSWTSLAWRNGLNNATRQIGFHNRSKDFAAFVRALVHELSLSSSVAA